MCLQPFLTKLENIYDHLWWYKSNSKKKERKTYLSRRCPSFLATCVLNPWLTWSSFPSCSWSATTTLPQTDNTDIYSYLLIQSSDIHQSCVSLFMLIQLWGGHRRDTGLPVIRLLSLWDTYCCVYECSDRRTYLPFWLFHISVSIWKHKEVATVTNWEVAAETCRHEMKHSTTAVEANGLQELRSTWCTPLKSNVCL